MSQPPPASKSVRFDPVFPSSSSSSSAAAKNPEGSRIRGYRPGDGVSPPDHGINEQYSPSNDDRPSRHHNHRRRASQNDVERSPSPAPSDATVDLPPRFDQNGRRRPEKGEDPLADAMEALLSGNGPAGKLFTKFTGVLGLSDSSSGGAQSRRR